MATDKHLNDLGLARSWATIKRYIDANVGAGDSALSTRIAAIEQFFASGDTDTIINKWQEIIDFLDGISESTDLDSIIADLEAAIATKIPLSQKGAASGVATLDSDSKVPVAQLYTAYGNANGGIVKVGVYGDGAPLFVDNNNNLKLRVEETTGQEDGTRYPVTYAASPDNELGVNVPWTDQHVTAPENHYAPTAAPAAEITASQSGNAGAYAKDTEYTVVTGIKAQRDAKGHVTGMTFTAQKIKDTNTVYGADNGVALVGSNYVAELQSYTPKSAAAGTGKLYPVALDANGVLAVEVAWENGLNGITVMGDGNAITSASYNETTKSLTFTKGDSFLSFIPHLYIGTGKRGPSEDSTTTLADLTAQGYSAGVWFSVGAGVEMEAGEYYEGAGADNVNYKFSLALQSTTPRQDTAGGQGTQTYPVELDSQGDLAVHVPWTDTNTTYDTMTQAEATTGTSLAAKLITPKVLSDTIEEHIPDSMTNAEIDAVFAENWTPAAGTVNALVAASGTTLLAQEGIYYRFDAEVNTLAITLPAMSTVDSVRGLMVTFLAGATPAVTISSADGKTVRYYAGFAIEAYTRYELNFLYNGSYWVVAYGTVV